MRGAVAALLVAVSLGPATAAACDVPDGFTPRARLEAQGVVLIFQTVPAVIALGRHFSIDAVVCGDGGPPPRLTGVDARMPEHRHGMNYRPTVSPRDGGRYVADGLLFHMPGRWEVSFEIERDGRRTRLATDVVME